ncbi:hydroxymethylglutaryl-CoA lyase, partial [Arthrobacter sp. SIMBA_036]
EASREHGIPMRGYVSCVVECPYEGMVEPAAAAGVARRLRDLGCFEISLGDTIGRGRPEAVERMLAEVLEQVPADRLAGHFHDTAGRA